MARDLDLVIFGATGFTGKHAIPILHRLAKSNGRNFTWGVAGRSENKLKQVLAEAEKSTGASLDQIPVIIADVANEASLRNMASRARIIVNCCGPYRHFGEPVVKVCISEGTHHVDVSGEPYYMELMQLKYHNEAQEKGVYVVSACGFDSIPSDLGVVFLQDKFSGTLNSVLTYLEGSSDGDGGPGPAVNYGTWESAVYGLANSKDLSQLRRQLFPNRLPSLKPKLKAGRFEKKTDLIEGWVLPFLGSDRSIMRRSQRHFYESESQRPVQVETYFVVKSLLHVILFAIFGSIFAILTKFKFGIELLLKYPEIFSLGMFSHKPPSETKIRNQLFQLTLYGEGWKEKLADPLDQYASPVDSVIVGRVKGRDPAYATTCTCLLLAAITILTEPDKLPSTGGVYPPGAAFAKTSLVKQLNENDVKFEIVSQTDIKKSNI